MTQTVRAIYSNGVLRPVTPLEGVSDNSEVTVVVQSSEPAPREGPLDGWIGGVSDEDTAELLRVIEEEFEKVDPNDWE